MNAMPPPRVLTSLRNFREALQNVNSRPQVGYVESVSGNVIRGSLGGARLGDACELDRMDGTPPILGEVIGFDQNCVLISPAGMTQGISRRTRITSREGGITIKVGKQLLGRTLDSLGHPIDGTPVDTMGMVERSIRRAPPAPLSRELINEPFVTGIRAIDALTMIGRGQRAGIFGQAGSGKSYLLNMITRNAATDICVVAFIGERGREIREFIERHISSELRQRTIFVAATSDRPPMERVCAAYTATTIAEYFRDLGANVLLIVDSLTRFARARREVALQAGELPARQGFPASVFAEIPQLVERGGKTEAGSITSFYTVLIEGERNQDSLGEEVRSLLDGHIMLSDELAAQGHFPAIDVLASRSRLMNEVATAPHRRHADHVRTLLQRYREVELLVQIGEYKKGADPIADKAINLKPEIDRFLKQSVTRSEPLEKTLLKLEAIYDGN